MNYGAHLAVAHELRHRTDKPYLFGAMAPDFAGMADTRINISSVPTDIVRGISLHKRTDTVFHRLRLFSNHKKEARSELEPTFKHWPADICAELGIELLLDGILFENQTLSRSFDGAMSWALDNLGSLGAIARNARDFKKVIVDRAELGPPLAYQDPEVVARIIYQRLGDGHPKLAFGKERLPLLSTVYERQQEQLRKCANSLVSVTAQTINEQNS